MLTMCTQVMKKDLHIRISPRRLNKLRLIAVEQDKTMTQVVEGLLDSLPEPKNTTVTKVTN